MEEHKDVPMVPKWQAEETYMHMGKNNERMLIALLAVCITFILTIIIFVCGYTVREKNWLDTITRLSPVVEVQNGVHEQPNQDAH